MSNIDKKAVADIAQKEITLEKTKRLAAGTRAIKGAHILMIVHGLVLFSLCCENMADGMGVFLSRLGQNMSMILTAFISLNFRYISLLVAYLMPLNSICIVALTIALIALLHYKNKQAKYTVVFGIVLVVVTSLVELGSAEIL